MRIQGMGGFSSGWLHNRGESAINGWDISQRDGFPARDGWLTFLSIFKQGCWMRDRCLDGLPWRMF